MILRRYIEQSNKKDMWFNILKGDKSEIERNNDLICYWHVVFNE